MYAHGRGVSLNRVVAYALYNLSAVSYPSKDNKATANRAKLAEAMNIKEVEAAQVLSRVISKTGNLLKEIDKYVNSPIPKGKQQ